MDNFWFSALNIVESVAENWLEAEMSYVEVEVGARFSNTQKQLNSITVQVFFVKNIEKSTCAVMIRTIITFGKQFL